MASPPTGILTFLFTDIEGSTRLWENYPEAMQASLARHDEILRGSIEGRGAYVFKTVGDAFCCAFATHGRSQTVLAHGIGVGGTEQGRPRAGGAVLRRKRSPKPPKEGCLGARAHSVGPGDRLLLSGRPLEGYRAL